MKIYETFFTTDSPYEINTCDEVLEEIKKNILQEIFEETLFENIYREIIWLLKDTFGRFLESEEYKNRCLLKVKPAEETLGRRSLSNIFGKLTSSPKKKNSLPKSSSQGKRRNYTETETSTNFEGFSM
jgi:hypothetical protein